MSTDEDLTWEVEHDTECPEDIKCGFGYERPFILHFDRGRYCILVEKEEGKWQEIVSFPSAARPDETDGLSCPQCQGGPIYPDARGGYNCGHCDCWFEIKKEP